MAHSFCDLKGASILVSPRDFDARWQRGVVQTPYAPFASPGRRYPKL